MGELAYRVYSGVLGAVVGDAVGVPFEFMSREEAGEAAASLSPESLPGGGTWGQPPGVWSDDGALVLASGDALARYGASLEALAEAFLAWYTRGAYMPEGIEVFDVGNTTREALERLLSGVPPSRSGSRRASCGSLMRIYPVSAYTLCDPRPRAYEFVAGASRITHDDPEAVAACLLYSEAVWATLRGAAPLEAVAAAGEALRRLPAAGIPGPVARLYSYLGDPEALASLDPGGVRASCRASETLKAALWAYLNSDSYFSTIVNAISLGGDTDTVAAIAGALAGTHYGARSIPPAWREGLRSRNLVESIARRLGETVEARCREKFEHRTINGDA